MILLLFCTVPDVISGRLRKITLRGTMTLKVLINTLGVVSLRDIYVKLGKLNKFGYSSIEFQL